MRRRWKTGGGRIIGVSNQGGIALGHVTKRDCAAAMVGDRPEDQECARIASIDFQWAAEWRAQTAVSS